MYVGGTIVYNNSRMAAATAQINFNDALKDTPDLRSVRALLKLNNHLIDPLDTTAFTMACSNYEVPLISCLAENGFNLLDEIRPNGTAIPTPTIQYLASHYNKAILEYLFEDFGMDVSPVDFSFVTAVRAHRPDLTMIMHLMSLGACTDVYHLIEFAQEHDFYQLLRVLEPDRSLPRPTMPIYKQVYISCCFYSPCCIWSRHCYNYGVAQANASDNELCCRCCSSLLTCCTVTPFLACLELCCCSSNSIESICHWCYPRERVHVSEDGQQWYIDYVPATCCRMQC